MAKGSNAVHYAWRVKQGANTLMSGGYLSDGAVLAAGSPPEGDGAEIRSEGRAFSQCASAIKGFQSRGIDCGGEILYRVFGQDATDPKNPLPAALRADILLCKIDVVERGVRRLVSLSNTEKSDDEKEPGPLQLPQEVLL